MIKFAYATTLAIYAWIGCPRVFHFWASLEPAAIDINSCLYYALVPVMFSFELAHLFQMLKERH